MEISDLIPADGHPQRIYCDECGEHFDLAFDDFDHKVSGKAITVVGLPVLRCFRCRNECLPDRSRYQIVRLHEKAHRARLGAIKAEFRRDWTPFRLTEVDFVYDPADYYFIPGLWRPQDDGFLTPVFFNPSVLVKYYNHAEYSVIFHSATYGDIRTPDGSIAFGINRSGHIVMWLGDVARFPKSEQYYLRSENIPSDHSVGSEFYDGQIEVKFTDPSLERTVMAQRSLLSQAFAARFGYNLFQLDEEVIACATKLLRPITDTAKEREATFSNINRIFVESLDSAAIRSSMLALNIPLKKDIRSLKALEITLTALEKNASELMLPFYVSYDLRVAYSHLLSGEKRAKSLASALGRLALNNDAQLKEMYDALLTRMRTSMKSMADAIGGPQ